jgi:hypothetical protein
MPDFSTSQKVLDIVQQSGPLIPSDVSKKIGTNIIIASALLSELASKKAVRMSHLKMGGTPLYYTAGQEAKLQEFIRFLHEKERKAYELLKNEMVLRDAAQEPVMRVALREIKDFAIPLNVQTETGIETFWKWYLNSNEEAEIKIKALLGTEDRQESDQEEIRPSMKQPDEQPTLIPEKKPELPKQKRKSKPVSDAFLESVYEYFRKNGIEMISRDFNKKKTEAEFVISVPSPVGSIKYYCKAKDKKLCTDGDISSAYVQGQAKKLPVLFLSNGGLTKKATEMLEREFSSINVKSL